MSKMGAVHVLLPNLKDHLSFVGKPLTVYIDGGRELFQPPEAERGVMCSAHVVVRISGCSVCACVGVLGFFFLLHLHIAFNVD